MYDSLRAQMEAMKGTGRFADLGSLSALEAEQRPIWTDIELGTLKRGLLGTPGQTGLLDLYRHSVTPSLAQTEAEASRYQRLSDLADVRSMGAGATQAFLGADPMKKEASDLLLQGAIDDYKLGATLDPSLRREVQQGYRNAAGARGVVHSPFSAAEEAYWQGLQAQQLKQQRQSALSQLMGQRQALTGDPFMQVLGRQGQAFGASQGYGAQGMGFGQSLGPKIYQPQSQLGADLAMSNYQGQLAANQASAMNRTSVLSGAMGMGGSIIGGLGRGGFFN